jgi:hypothetical protein
VGVVPGEPLTPEGEAVGVEGVVEAPADADAAYAAAMSPLVAPEPLVKPLGLAGPGVGVAPVVGEVPGEDVDPCEWPPPEPCEPLAAASMLVPGLEAGGAVG